MKSVSRKYLIDFATATVPGEWSSLEVRDIYN